MKKKYIASIILAIVIVAGIGGGTAYAMHVKQENAMILAQAKEKAQHQAVLKAEELKNAKIEEQKVATIQAEKIANENFTATIQKAFKEMDRDNSTVNYKKTIDSISTKNLSSANITKLNNMKSTMADMTKVCEAENQLEANKFKEAAITFKEIDQKKLEDAGLMSSSVFSSMESSINKGIQSSQGITFGDLPALLTKAYHGEVAFLPDAKMLAQRKAFIASFANGGEGNAPVPEITGNLAICGSEGMEDIPTASTKLTNPTITINGIPAYLINLQGGNNWIDGGRGANVTTIVSTTGHVYTTKEVHAAMSNGTLLENIDGKETSLQIGDLTSGVSSYMP